MLLCLEREQRLAFVLGEIFGAADAEGADALGTTRDGFRQRLSRARRQLHAFLSGRCGLVDPANPCRCARKTRAFVRAGIIDPARLQFTAAHRARVEEVAPARAGTLDRAAAAFARLWGEHPFYEPPALAEALSSLVDAPATSPPASRRSPSMISEVPPECHGASRPRVVNTQQNDLRRDRNNLRGCRTRTALANRCAAGLSRISLKRNTSRTCID